MDMSRARVIQVIVTFGTQKEVLGYQVAVAGAVKMVLTTIITMVVRG